MSVEYMIVCDGCAGVIEASRRSARVAREVVRQDGGRTNLSGGKDLCGDCIGRGIGVDGSLAEIASTPDHMICSSTNRNGEHA